MHRRISWNLILWLIGGLLLSGWVVGCTKLGPGDPNANCNGCQPDERRCMNDKSGVLVCREVEGRPGCFNQVLEACPQGYLCEGKTAAEVACQPPNPAHTCPGNPVCKPGTRRCEGEVVATCVYDQQSICGRWQSTQTCGLNQRCDPKQAQCVSNTSGCQPNNTQAEKRCVGNAIHWFDNCGNQGQLISNCPANETCQNGQCMGQGCQPTNQQANKQCVGSAIHWFDNCGNQGAKVEDCANGCENGQCKASQGCQPQNPQAQKKCVGTAVHWFDDCGQQGAKVEDCANGCENGQCKPNHNCNECQPGQLRCSSNGTDVQNCSKDNQGCYKWSTPGVPCASGMICKNGQCELDKTNPGPSQGAVGSTCAQDSDCSGNVCIDWGIGSYCSAQCSGSPCPNGSLCVNVPTTQGNLKLCLKSCQSSADCLPNFKCNPQAGNTCTR